jgi:multidrug efflux system membrane fusion protein
LAACSGNEQKEKKELVIPVKTEVAKQQQVSKQIVTSGKVTSSKEAKLSFKIPGIVKSISVKEGQSVKAGQLLASLDLSEMKANLTKAQNGFAKAERDLERIRSLYEDDVTTKEQLQNMETAYEVAKSDLEIAEFNFKYAKITAPSNGTILMKNVEENELVNAGYPVILFGSKSSNWKIETSVSDVEIVQLAIGDSASITFDAYAAKTFTGQVSEVGQSADPRTGTYQVVIILDKTEVKIASGFVGKVRIYPSSKDEVVLIPIEALTQSNKNSAIVFTQENDIARSRNIKTAGVMDQYAIVTSGLKNGDVVITDGAEYLSDNARIKVVSVN